MQNEMAGETFEDHQSRLKTLESTCDTIPDLKAQVVTLETDTVPNLKTYVLKLETSALKANQDLN